MMEVYVFLTAQKFGPQKKFEPQKQDLTGEPFKVYVSVYICITIVPYYIMDIT